MVRAVLVANDADDARPCRSSASARDRRSRSGRRPCARAPAWRGSTSGRARSAFRRSGCRQSRIRWRMPGHASPSPSSEVTPGLMSWSATRIVSRISTSCLRNSPPIRSIILSVEEGSPPLRLSVQLRAIALSAIDAVLPLRGWNGGCNGRCTLCAGARLRLASRPVATARRRLPWQRRSARRRTNGRTGG